MSDYSKKNEFAALVAAVNKKITIEKKDPNKTIGDNNLVANKLMDIGKSILEKSGIVIEREDLLNYYAVLRALAKQEYFGGYSDKLEAGTIHTQPETKKSNADLTPETTQLIEHLFKAKKLDKDQRQNLKPKFRHLINQESDTYKAGKGVFNYLLSFAVPIDPITSFPESQKNNNHIKSKVRKPLQVQVVGKSQQPNNTSAVNSVGHLNSYQAGINNNNNSNNQANHKRSADVLKDAQTQPTNGTVVKKYIKAVAQNNFTIDLL